MEENKQAKDNIGFKFYTSRSEEHYDYDENGRKVTKRTSKEGYHTRDGKDYYKENNYFIDNEGKKHEEEIYAGDKEFVAKQQDGENIQYFTDEKKTIDEKDFNKKKETFNTLKKESNIDTAFDNADKIFKSPIFNNNIIEPLFENINNNVDNVNDFFSIFNPALNKYKPFGLLLPNDANEEKKSTNKKNDEDSIDNIDDDLEEADVDNNETAVNKVKKSYNKIKKNFLSKNNNTEKNEEIKYYKATISKLQKKIRELENSVRQLQNTNQKLLNTHSTIKRKRTF